MTTRSKGAGGRGYRRFWADRRGVTLALVALTVPILVAITGLGVDAGWWYTVRRQNQSAADAGAISAAYEVLAGKTDVTNNLVPAAQQAAATQNFYAGDALSGGCALNGTSNVCYPYTDSFLNSLTPPVSGVQVVLNQQQNTWFASLASLANVTIANRAVAAVETLGPGCITAVSPTGTTMDGRSGVGIGVIGSAVVNTPNCILTSFSTGQNSIYVQGGNNANITAQTLVAAGQVSETGQPVLTLADPVQVGAPPSELVNPYAPDPTTGTCPPPPAGQNAGPCLTHAFLTTGMPPATACGGPTSVVVKGVTWSRYPAGCKITNGANQNQPTLPQNNIQLLGNNILASGFNIKGQTVDLTPGTYWVTDGDLNLLSNGVLECSTCSTVTGAGVTIIFTTTTNTRIGTITMAANATLNGINAPNSGTFSGILFAQDTVAGVTYSQNGTIQGNSNANFVGTGLIYFPNTNIQFQGTPTAGTAGCLILYASTVQLQGNPELAAAGCANAGLNQVPQVKTVALVQ